MITYNIPLSENGRMILPIELRRKLGVGKGDKVVVRTNGDRIELTTAKELRRRSREIVRRAVPEGHRMVDALLAERRSEVQQEEEEVDRGPGRVAEPKGHAE